MHLRREGERAGRGGRVAATGRGVRAAGRANEVVRADAVGLVVDHAPRAAGIDRHRRSVSGLAAWLRRRAATVASVLGGTVPGALAQGRLAPGKVIRAALHHALVGSPAYRHADGWHGAIADPVGARDGAGAAEGQGTVAAAVACVTPTVELQLPPAGRGRPAALVVAARAAAGRHPRHGALLQVEVVRQVARDHRARLLHGVALGALGVAAHRRRHPRRHRRLPQHLLLDRLGQAEAEGVGESRPFVSDMHGVHIVQHDNLVAAAHRTICKLDVLAERDVGKHQLAAERRAVREAGPEDAAAVHRLVHAEHGHRHHVRQPERRELGLARDDRRHLRPHPVGHVDVVVVPVDDDLAPGRDGCRGALLADRGVARHDAQSHGQPGRVGDRNPRRIVVDELKGGKLGPKNRLEGDGTVVHDERLERAVVLRGDLAQCEQHVLRPIAREHHDGRKGVGGRSHFRGGVPRTLDGVRGGRPRLALGWERGRGRRAPRER